MLTSQKMTRKAQELQAQCDLLHEKIARLRKAAATEVNLIDLIIEFST